MYNMHYARSYKKFTDLSESLTLIAIIHIDRLIYCTLPGDQSSTRTYLSSGAGLFGRFAKTDAGGAKFQTMTSPSSTMLALYPSFENFTPRGPAHPGLGDGRRGRLTRS